jgi:hypothetical protein
VTRYLGWSMEYVGNPDCLADPNVQCPGVWKGDFTTCRNGNGQWICMQNWEFVGGDLSMSEVPVPGPESFVSSHGGVCSTAGSAATAPVYGCQGAFWGCSGSKGWGKNGYNMRCYPRN